MMFHIVLYEPQIPQNTGNIARTCMVTGSRLHLIEPLGFSIDDSRLKRAGLDYWKDLDLVVHPGWDSYAQLPGRRWYIDTCGSQYHTDTDFSGGDHLVFGCETKGLPRFLTDGQPSVIRLPMRPAARSLNLSNAVAVTVYEALRQTGFAGIL
jgi:tRNA (cytidine/uridine-2'-O-)-methyltransferase